MVQAETSPATLASLFEELINQKAKSVLDGEQPNFEQGLRAASVQVLELRALLRERCEMTEALREATAVSKTRLDESSLVLKNLAYEREHYSKETAACRAFRSAFSDDTLELLPLADFVKIWGDKDGTDTHRTMLNRLTHEMVYRKETVQQLDGLRSKRDALAADVAQRRSALGGLEGELAALHAKGRALAERYGAAVPQGPVPTRLAPASALPLPLYILYSQLLAAARRQGGGSAAAPSGRHVSVDIHQPAACSDTPGVHSVRLCVADGVGQALAGVDFRVNGAGTAVLATPVPPTAAEQLAAVCSGNAGVPGSAGGEAAEQGAYAWAQALAGLDILPALPPTTPSNEELQAAMARYAAEGRASTVLDRLLAQCTGGSGGAMEE